MARASKLANNVLVLIGKKEYFYIEKEFRRFVEGAKEFVIEDEFKYLSRTSNIQARYVQENEMSDRYKKYYEF